MTICFFCFLLSKSLCVGNFWTTAERQSLTTMSSAVAVDSFFMITNRKATQTSWEVMVGGMGKVFQPLQNELWGCLFAVCIYAAISMFLVEDVDWEELGRIRDRALTDIPDVRGFRDDLRRIGILLHDFPFQAFLQRLYQQMTSLFRVESYSDVKSTSGRIIDVGVSTSSIACKLVLVLPVSLTIRIPYVCIERSSHFSRCFSS